MHNVLTLLKLEFKNSQPAGLTGKKAFWHAASVLLSVAIVYYAVLLGARLYFQMFHKAGLDYAGLVLVFSLMFLVLCFLGISSVTKVLYFKGDNEMLMRYPVTGAQIFVSKVLFLFVTQLVLTTAIILPFIIAYTEVVPADGTYIRNAPLAILFLVLIPFFLSNLLAIPFMHMGNKVRHRFGMMIVGMALVMTMLFASYMVLFEYLVNFLRDSEFSAFSDEMTAFLGKIVYYFVPTKYFAGMLTGTNGALSVGVLSAITVALGAAATYATKKLYLKTLLKSVEVEGSAYKRVTKNRARSVFFSILKKEFLQIFRSVNYSFQYFVLACTMPFMVYSCNNIAINIGKNDIGNQIVPGLTLLVMLIFATVITSFSATSVTREGANFYHTKIMPVSVRTQLLVKFFMYLIVSLAANLITVAVIVLSRQTGLREAVVIFGIVQGISIALTLSSMKTDIKRPQFNLSGEGELVSNNRNTTSAIFGGFAVALIEGIVGMFVAFVYDTNLAYTVCAILAGGIFVLSLVRYSANLTKVYNRIT